MDFLPSFPSPGFSFKCVTRGVCNRGEKGHRKGEMLAHLVLRNFVVIILNQGHGLKDLWIQC